MHKFRRSSKANNETRIFNLREEWNKYKIAFRQQQSRRRLRNTGKMILDKRLASSHLRSRQTLCCVRSVCLGKQTLQKIKLKRAENRKFNHDDNWSFHMNGKRIGIARLSVWSDKRYFISLFACNMFACYWSVWLAKLNKSISLLFHFHLITQLCKWRITFCRNPNEIWKDESRLFIFSNNFELIKSFSLLFNAEWHFKNHLCKSLRFESFSV